MEELHMTPVYQVFIVVLVQGATRSGFHHRTDLFFFTFATKAPISKFSLRHFFLWIFRVFEKNSSLFNLNSAPIGRINYDKPRP